jgi:large subunit ribosomal protein L25
VTGEPAAGGVLNIELNALSVEVEATHIPEAVEFSVEGAEPGTQVHAGQIQLPAGASLAGDPEAIAVLVSTADSDAEESADSGAEGEAEPGQPAADNE